MNMEHGTHSIQARPKAVAGANWMKLVLAALALVFVVSLQYAPSVTNQRRDSGIFAYTGKVITEGGLPYVDAWDNKLPGVYYIDALAFVLFGTNLWALWLFENLTLVITALVLSWVLKQAFREQTKLWLGPVLLILFVRHPGLISDVNFTEPYALLPQVVILAAGYQFLRQPSYRLGFLIGFASGVALLIKQTTVGGALMFVPAILISRHPVLGTPARWRWLTVIVAGGLTCLGLVALYLLANGILDDALQASFVAATSFHDWVSNGSAWIGATVIKTLTATTFPLVYGPFFPFIGVGMALALRRVRDFPYPDRQTATDATLAIWAALTFVLDMILANITNRGYAHYYVTLVPSVILLTMLSLPAMARYVARSGFRVRLVFAALRLELIVFFIVVPIVASLIRFWVAGWDVVGPERITPLATYVMENTEPGDGVLVWGADTAINFQSGRDSPTPYNYGYPLIVPNEESGENVRQMVKDLERNKPVMIVDTTLRDGNRIPPLHPLLRQLWWFEGGRRDTERLDPIYRFVESYCHVATEYDGAVIYRCRYPIRTGVPGGVLIDPPIQAAATIWNDVVDQYQQPVEKFITDTIQPAAPAK
jgi:4-amino-4-deoxy-L-arabinose transferase-like glycosyltransferase